MLSHPHPPAPSHPFILRGILQGYVLKNVIRKAAEAEDACFHAALEPNANPSPRRIELHGHVETPAGETVSVHIPQRASVGHVKAAVRARAGAGGGTLRNPPFRALSRLVLGAGQLEDDRSSMDAVGVVDQSVLRLVSPHPDGMTHVLADCPAVGIARRRGESLAFVLLESGGVGMPLPLSAGFFVTDTTTYREIEEQVAEIAVHHGIELPRDFGAMPVNCRASEVPVPAVTFAELPGALSGPGSCRGIDGRDHVWDRASRFKVGRRVDLRPLPLPRDAATRDLLLRMVRDEAEARTALATM